MNIQNLWTVLPHPSEQNTTFKKDIAEGKVPELPFFIIGQEDLKKKIKAKLEQIDLNRMITNLIIAEYGNGKTNLLKYLELFFKINNDLGVSVQYSRADVERTDLVLFLLKIVQDKYLEDLIEIINDIRNKPEEIPSLVNNYESNFREIKQYCEKLFSISNSNEEITEIIYLGTGRLNNKRYFDKRGLEQLRDFNRREILVLLLNLLSYKNKYVIFAIDEIEKIREKSKIRFSHFLTSYRELIDLFNQINGHYLLVSFTDGIGSSEISNTNHALYTRIKDDIVNIEALTTKKDISELISHLNELFDTKKNVDDVYTSFNKKKPNNNRLAIQEISKLLYEQDTNESLNEMLISFKLEMQFNNTESKLSNDEAFKNLHRKFFDPFEYYIESIGLDSNGLNKQDRIYIDSINERIHYFIFNTYLEDYENEKIKILNLLKDNPNYSVIVYAPIALELTHSKLNIEDSENLILIDIEPKELFILLVMYKDNYDLESQLNEVISKYTNQKL